MKNLRYFFTWVLGLALVITISETQAGTNVPVLIWDSDLPVSSKDLVDPFEKTSREDFEKDVTKIVGGSLKPVLVFVRDDLCVEDLAKHKDSLGSLTDAGTFFYRSAVDTPVSIFEKLPSYNCTTEEELESISEGQLILTKIADFDGIVKTINIIKESSPNLVAALTGKSCRYSRTERKKRATEDEPEAPPKLNGHFLNETRILFYANSAPGLTVSGDESIVVTLVKNGTQEGNGTEESPLQLNFEYSIKNGTATYTANVLLQFLVKTAGYYTPNVLYKRADTNTTLKAKGDLSFPYNFSYHCSHNISFGNSDLVRFSLEDFQVQIDATNFGDAYDCVGFTSIPIWAGIFVTSILAIIMIWGLTMIMDIRTMDRFDDPKGKTITISASAD